MENTENPHTFLQDRFQNLENELKDYKRRLSRIRRLQRMYEGFITDPCKNMEVILEHAAKLLGFPTSLYNRYCDDRRCLTAFSGYNLPEDFEMEGSPEGHICYEEIIKGENAPVIFEDLAKTVYAETDPGVKKYSLKAYLGYPVSLDGKVRGSLCVVDMKKRTFTESDINIITTLAKALSLEEERLEAEEAIKNKIAQQKMLADISTQAIYVGDRPNFLANCLSILGENLDLGGIFVREYDPGSDSVSEISQWCGQGLKLKRPPGKNTHSSKLPWSIDVLKNGGIINYSDTESCCDLGDKESLRTQGITSLLVLPIVMKTEFYGCIGFEEYDRYREWSDADINNLRTASQIIIKGIEAKMAEDALLEANQTLERRVERRTESLEKTYRELQQRQVELQDHKEALERINKELIDTNKAITVLARNIENQKREVEFNVTSIVSKKILPLIEKALIDKNLKKARYDLQLASNYLQEMTGSFTGQTNRFMELTETEARIAGMIQKGMTSATIAKALFISLNTVKTHRKNIRKKLDVQNAPINLKNYLKTEPAES